MILQYNQHKNQDLSTRKALPASSQHCIIKQLETKIRQSSCLAKPNRAIRHGARL